MLRVLLLLGGLWGPGASLKKDSTRLHVQITVPEKISSLTSEGPESEVSYRIAVEGETYTVKLTQKSFLSRDFKVYGYDGAGIMKPLEEHIQNFCYYQGYVEGYPKSLVIISTCTGLRGLLQFENISYGIEPLESSVGFEHVLYQVKHENKSVSLHAEKEIDLKNKNYRIKSVKPSPEFPRYIEMHIIVEKNLYERMGADTATVTQKIFQLVGLMNAFFSSFNLTVILASLELWTDENKISTDGDINELLYNFQNWKKSYLVLRPHDVAFLLVYREASSYVGAIFQGMICDKDYGGGVALHPKIVSLDAFAVVLVQLVSLSMGISYDDTDRCPCPGAVCVMNPDAIHFSGVKVFSNCSKEDFVQFMSRQMSHCLQNQPPMELAYRAAPVCGNLVLEAGEDCDCGTQQECESITPVCCEAATCRLKASSQCAVGLCCDNCKFRPKGHTCRAAADECDLPEFCNGTSASCQEDFFIHNGHRCGGNKWVCIEGKCLTGKKQCAEAFGDAIDFGTEECFEQLNSRSDITGNCGIAAPGMYTACPPGSRKCGKLICLYSKQEILQNRHAIIIYANIDGKICVSLEYTQDHSDSGRMWVKDGTVCGTKKVCRNKACVDDTYLDYDCTPDTCSRRGVCNNKKHCHCNARYLPPNCRNSDASSAGGSVDSGNARFEPIPERNYIESVYRTKPKKWPFFLVIPFFIILSVLVAIVVKVYYQRKKWKTEDYKSDEDLESESKSQNTKE